MQHHASSGFELLDHNARAVAGCLDDANPGGDDGVGVGGIVGGVDGGEEGQVDTEGAGGHGTTAGDFLGKSGRCGLSQAGQDAKAACVADGGGKVGVANPLHATLDDGDANAEGAGQGGIERHG